MNETHIHRGAVFQANVARLSVPLDQFGILQGEFANTPPSTKRKRKTHFNKLRNTLRVFGFVDPKDRIHSISVGLDAGGNHAVEVTYTPGE